MVRRRGAVVAVVVLAVVGVASLGLAVVLVVGAGTGEGEHQIATDGTTASTGDDTRRATSPADVRVTVTSPAPGAPLVAGEVTAVAVELSDAAAVETLALEVDGGVVGDPVAIGEALSWRAEAGDHVLTVVAELEDGTSVRSGEVEVRVAAPTTTAAPTTAPPPSGPPATDPVPVDRWVVVIESLAVGEYTFAAAAERAATFAAQGVAVHLLDSSEFSSLNAGYWVVYTGSHADRDTAQAACEGIRTIAPACYARYVAR